MLNYTRLIADLAGYGVTIDKSVTDALALLAAAREVVVTDPTADLRTEYEAGALTVDNVRERMITAATVAAAAERIRLAAQTIEGSVSGTVNAWIRANGDSIIKQLQPKFTEAAAVVQVAGQHFAPNATAETILKGGAEAAAAHEKLSQALATLDHLRSLRMSVADVTGDGPQDATWWIDSARDVAELDRAGYAYRGSGNAFHALAHAGFTLRMNTTADATRVASGARATTEAEETAAREAHLAEHRESWAGYFDTLARLSPTKQG